MNEQKLNKIAELTGMSAEAVEEIINYDWYNDDEHAEWIESASADEIADWVESVA